MDTPAEPLVETLDHVGTLVDRMIGGARQRMFEEVARPVRPGDELLDGGDLLADHAPPLLARLVQHGRGRVQADARRCISWMNAKRRSCSRLYMRLPPRRSGVTNPLSS